MFNLNFDMDDIISFMEEHGILKMKLERNSYDDEIGLYKYLFSLEGYSFYEEKDYFILEKNI